MFCNFRNRFSVFSTLLSNCGLYQKMAFVGNRTISRPASTPVMCVFRIIFGKPQKKKKESQVRKIVDTLRFTWLKCDHSRVWPCTLSPFHRCGSFFSTFYWFRIRIGIKFRLNFATKMSFGTRDTWRLKGESRIYWVNIYFEQMRRRPRNSSINISRKAQTLTKHHWCQLGNHVIICDLKKWKWGKPSFWRFMLISIRVVCDGNHANMAVKLGCTFMSEEILRGLMSHWLKSLIKLFKLLILLDELHEL